MENPIKMDDLGCFPPIFGNTHIALHQKNRHFRRTIEVMANLDS